MIEVSLDFCFQLYFMRLRFRWISVSCFILCDRGFSGFLFPALFYAFEVSLDFCFLLYFMCLRCRWISVSCFILCDRGVAGFLFPALFYVIEVSLGWPSETSVA